MNVIFMVMALLLFVSVIASRLSARLGMPLLLAFLGVGMLAGEEGIGIEFDSFAGAAFIGQLALAVILLDGGLRTKFETFRIAILPASILATWGVLASVLLLGTFATFYLNIDWQIALLMAAIVGSTDAAAVFSLLRNSGVRLHPRIQAALELESGINDPMAILLVTVFIGLIIRPDEMTSAEMALILVKQIGLGLGVGLLAGAILAKLLARIRLAEGLYAIMIASGGLLVFAVTNLVEGSGFLAVYLTGVLVGNSRNSSVEHVLNVMDGLAWLAQAGMFLVLGLLVTPSRLLEHGWQALLIALFLILIARPIAVWSALRWFRFTSREIAYISWVGLRGAVPVTLAIMPLMSGVPKAQMLFDVAFAVVILSLAIQGTTIPYLARKMKMVLPQKPEALESREFWLGNNLAVTMQSFCVEQDSDAQYSHPYVMTRAFKGCRLFSLIRGNETVHVDMNTQMQAGDIAWYVLDEKDSEAFALQFSGQNRQDEQAFFGEFVVRPDVKMGDLANIYGIQIEDEEHEMTLAQLFRSRFGTIAVAGDRLDLAGFCITVKELDEQSYIKQLGLKLPHAKVDS